MLKICFRAAAAAALAILVAVPAHGQATRTWVSGVGDDVNPCSRTAPCKTFAGAISKTAAGGEINCLDPGGFGAVTITKSITIDCTGTLGSILNSGGINGIVVNDSATATPGTIQVIIRGISIDGAGVTPGLNGIRFISGRSLTLQDVFIQNQRGSNGISIQPTSAIRFQAENVSVVNGNGGILIAPTGAGSARVSLRNTFVANNTTNGLRLDTSGTTATNGIQMSVERCHFAGNVDGISTNSGGSLLTAMIADSVISTNSGTGILAAGLSSSLLVGSSSITGNAIGVSASGGAAIRTYGDNRLDGNPNLATPNDGTFSGTALPKR